MTAADAPTAADITLSAHGLKCVRGGRTLIEDLDLTVEPGRPVHLLGANGSGKTTLLRTLASLRPPEAGQIHWCGRPLERVRAEFLQTLAYIGHAAGLKQDLSASENLAAHLALSGRRPVESIPAALAAVGLRRLADRPVRRLSAGQARRVVLAGLRLTTARLWILDEPFTALDADGRTLIRDLLIQHCNQGGLAVLTSHQAIDYGPLPVVEIRLGAAP